MRKRAFFKWYVGQLWSTQMKMKLFLVSLLLPASQPSVPYHKVFELCSLNSLIHFTNANHYLISFIDVVFGVISALYSYE